MTLGIEARDSCWFAPVALQQSIELVRDAITPVVSKPAQVPEELMESCRLDPATVSSCVSCNSCGMVNAGSEAKG